MNFRSARSIGLASVLMMTGTAALMACSSGASSGTGGSSSSPAASPTGALAAEDATTNALTRPDWATTERFSGLVADTDSIELLRTIRGYDADSNAVVVGSPWLGFLADAPASWTPDDRPAVLYAPTWEGDRPTMDYGSVESLGDAIVTAVLASPGLRLIYRPHPWLGRVRASSAAADARLRRLIVDANRGDVVDTGEYGWALGAASLCITDVSSVSSDAEALGVPLLLTTEVNANDPAGLRSLIEKTATGGAPPSSSSTAGVSMDALFTAVGDALKLGADSTL